MEGQLLIDLMKERFKRQKSKFTPEQWIHVCNKIYLVHAYNVQNQLKILTAAATRRSTNAR